MPDLAHRIGPLKRSACWALGAAILAVPSPARAVDFEKLVMPGKVIQGHAKVEGECGRCHAPFRAEAQDDLCIECHEEVGDDLRNSTGFHGRSTGVKAAVCKDCHGEHRGRDADIVSLDRAAFLHDVTDQPLRGAHRAVSCEGCHRESAAFREAPSSCADCHQDDDIHERRLGQDCASCHVERAWSEARFDHSKTDFPLEGEHAEVDCVLCHPGNRFERTASDCLGCHRLNDVHLGRFGTGCGKCHSARGWHELRFDHDRDTRFPLAGRHRRAKCRACHEGTLYREDLPRDCVGCHRTDDVHRGRNGDSCERCHSASSWKPERFDHGRMTEFPLRGAHSDLKCERCHMGPVGEQKLSTACYSCHRDDDVHGGQQGRTCEQCHNERGWGVEVFFEHDLTRFPLLGLHAVAACEQCHVTPRFRDAKLDCVGCHRDDDPHLARLGPRCGLCHNPNGWRIWQFDHTEQTGFELHGAHAILDCHACHRAPVADEIDLPRSCQGCHASDDPHYGAFGPDCQRCHSDDSWRNVRVGR